MSNVWTIGVTGLSGVLPRIVYLNTTDTLTEILAPDYAIGQPLSITDFVFCSYGNPPNIIILQPSINGGVTTLVPFTGDEEGIPNGIQYFVSKQIGNDLTGNGSIERPYASFTKAIEVVGSPSFPIQIIGMDADTYDEQLIINFINIYVNAIYARIFWTGAGDTVIVNAMNNGFPLLIGELNSASGNALVNNSSDVVVANIGSLLGGNVVNNGTGIVLLSSDIVDVDINNTSTGHIVYNITARIGGIDSTGVTGYYAGGTNQDWIIGGKLSAAGLNYPSVDGVSGSVVTTDGLGNLTLLPPSGGGGGLTPVGISGTTQAAAINTYYVVQNDSQTTITLPATAPLGSIVVIKGIGAAGWILNANTGQALQIGSAATSPGGGITSQNQYDSIQVSCIVADTTWSMDWAVTSGFTINPPGP